MTSLSHQKVQLWLHLSWVIVRCLPTIITSLHKASKLLDNSLATACVHGFLSWICPNNHHKAIANSPKEDFNSVIPMVAIDQDCDFVKQYRCVIYIQITLLFCDQMRCIFDVVQYNATLARVEWRLWYPHNVPNLTRNTFTCLPWLNK